MTRRPERLKATKLYGSENVADRPKQFGENDNKPTTQNLSETYKNRSKSEKSAKTGVPEKKTPVHSNTNTISKLADTQKGNETTPKYSKIPPPNTNDPSPKKNVVNGISKGFVTRTEMEQRVARRKSFNEEKPHKAKNIKASLLDDNKTSNNPPLKGNAHSKVPLGFVTVKDMEIRIKNRKTKSTKLTPLYPEEQTGDIVKVPSLNTERDPRIKTKPSSNSKHVFSKLERRQDEPLQTEETKQLDKRLPKQNKVGDNDVPKTPKTSKSSNPPISRQKNSENMKANTNPKEVDKVNPNSDTSSQGRRESVTSAPQATVTITPRMTSTAIPKAPRNNAKVNKTDGDKLDSLKILIMNANGRDDKGFTPAERRKNAIQNVVLKHSPKIILFQEFSWKGVNGKTWAKYPIPEHYVFKGHYDAGIMYDATSITVKDLPVSDIQTILTGLQSNANNRLKRTFPMDFNPVSHMCLARVTAPTKPALDFICISWHGKAYENGGRMKELRKIEHFEYWMEFLRHIREKYKLPILAGGDYNVDMYSIETYVSSPFKLCIYEASMRRTVKGIVDFCIVTEDLDFGDISWVNLDHDTGVFHPNEILDHDPIVGSLAVSIVGASDMKLGKKKSWPSPIVKQK